jgi:hypothetical protein
MCVPIDDEINAGRLDWLPADLPARLRVVADAYGLDASGRTQLLELLSRSMVSGGDFVRRRVAASDRNFIAVWNEMGGEERFDRRREWWTRREDDFAVALR